MNIHTPQPATPNTPQELILRPAGLKEVYLQLVLNQPDVRKAEDEASSELDIIDQLINFQLEKLLVTVSLFYNGKKLEEKKCENIGVMVQVPSLGRENPFDDDRYTKVKNCFNYKRSKMILYYTFSCESSKVVTDIFLQN